MIVTTQAVFCVVKELLQSMLSYCHEDYHDSEDASNGYDAIETPQEDQGGLTEREELQTGTSRECNNSHVQPSVQSSNLKSENIASTNQANPLPCCDQTVLEEDSDNDTGSNTHHSRTDPNIEPSQCFDANLSARSLHLDSESKWLVELKSLYASNLLAEMKLLLQRAFKDSRNCFDFVLDVIKFADVDAGKKSLAYMTLCEFEAWLKTEGRDVQEIQQLGYWPSNNQKDLALEVVSSKFLLFELVKRTFQLNSADNSFLTKHVRVLINTRGKYKEAATIAYKLQLQRHFKATEILLPLIIVDKWQVAESYVTHCPESLQPFMMLINDLCEMTDDNLERVVENTVAPKPKDHKLKNKSLVKLGARFVKNFNLNAENYPNICKEEDLKALRDLVQKKYLEEKKLSSKWDRLIKGVLGNNEWLQHKLIECLVEFNDLEEAAKWTRHYRLPLESVHPLVKDFVERRQGASEDFEDWEAEIEGNSERKDIPSTSNSAPATCYRLPLSADRIVMVDNSQSLKECAQVLCKPGRVVGFDTEWRPAIRHGGTDVRVSIMQLSYWRNVFILDLIALKGNVKDSEMQQFAESFFANHGVLKLGYGVESDFKNLVSSCPPFKDAVTNLTRFVDLCPFSEQLLRIPSVQKEVSSRVRTVSAREREEERGLSKLAFTCLGQPLDKMYQLSEWEQRPLREDQVIYAATDAYCLLEIYDALQLGVVGAKVQVDMESCVVLRFLHPKKKRERRSTRKQPKPGTHSNDLLPPARKGDPIPPQSLRVVVDTMLLGLGRLLRQYGIDAFLLDKKGDQERAVKVAQTGNRIILTTGSRYEQLCAQVPEEMCVCVPSGKIQQQVNYLVEYLNVQVKKKDILSRCQDCNGDQFFHVSKDDMQLVVKISHGEVLPPGFEQKNCPVNLKDLTLPSGVSLQLNPPPDTESDGVAIFLCCSKCGKIFSKGRRRERIIEELLENLGSSQKQD